MKYRVLVPLTLAIAISAFIFTRPNFSADPSERTEAEPQRPLPIFAVGIAEGARPEIAVNFETSARVQEVFVREGDRVAAGDRIATLDRREKAILRDLASAKLMHARAELISAQRSNPEEIEIAKARLNGKLAQQEREHKALERMADLYEQNAVADQKYDDQLAQYQVLTAEIDALEASIRLLETPTTVERLRVLESQVTAAEAELELAQLEIDRCELVAPNDGVIVELNIDPGEMIQLQNKEPAVILVDDSRIRVRAFVEEPDANHVESGHRVEIHLRGDAELPAIMGEVERTSPRFNRKEIMNRRSDERFDVRIRECWIELDNPQALILGAHVDVLIHAYDYSAK